MNVGLRGAIKKKMNDDLSSIEELKRLVLILNVGKEMVLWNRVFSLSEFEIIENLVLADFKRER